MERDACALLGLAPPASAADGLAAKVLADAHTRPGQDEALELLRRMLAQRLDCPAPALGLFGVGLLYLLTRKSEESIYIGRSEEHTSELQSLMRISSAVFCLKKKRHTHIHMITD